MGGRGNRGGGGEGGGSLTVFLLVQSPYLSLRVVPRLFLWWSKAITPRVNVIRDAAYCCTGKRRKLSFSSLLLHGV